MKNKRLWSFLLVMAMLFTVLAPSNGSVKAATNMKNLKVNQTVLEFKEIVYVDGTNGNDTTGDGSEKKPFASVVKGFEYMHENCREDGAIVIEDGVYDVAAIFSGNSCNVNAKYDKMKLSILAKTMGEVKFNNVGEWMITENSEDLRIKLSFYGIEFGSKLQSGWYELGSDDWVNEYYNCVFPPNYAGHNREVPDAAIRVENSVFFGTPYGAEVNMLKGVGINCASENNYIEPRKGDYTTCLFNASFDADYNITSEGWKNAGTGKNPDGSQAHIGVYGGPFAWGSKIKETNTNELDMVLEVGEKLLLSVDEYLSENINMNWTSSDESVATVDSNGVVTALKAGETRITVKSKNGKYTDIINILVVDDAEDYRLAVDLNIGESCRATIDKNKHTAIVTWSVADETVATVSSKGKITAQGKGLTIVTATGEDGQEVGHVYIRVR